MFEIDALFAFALKVVMPPAFAAGGAAFALGICVILIDAIKAMITRDK